MVVPLTGPAGRFGQAAAQAVELAFQELNKAAGPPGIAGCELVLDLRDDQGEGSVGVDQARQLVDLRKVPVIIGSIISSVTVPMVTAVTAPAGAHQISQAGENKPLVLSYRHIGFLAGDRRRPIRHRGRHEDTGHSLHQQ
jgi:branched-chain amino acid transport system substrate-binding protein